MLARPKLGDGRPCLPDRPRRIVAAASKDHVGTGAPARPVERSSTSGANCRCRGRSFAPPGRRGRPPLRGRADPARLSIPLHDRGIRQIGVTRPEQTKAVKRTSVPKTQKSLANCQQRGGCSASRFGKLAAASAEPWGPLLPVLAREEFAHIRFHLAVIGMNGGTQGGFR